MKIIKLKIYLFFKSGNSYNVNIGINKNDKNC